MNLRQLFFFTYLGFLCLATGVNAQMGGPPSGPAKKSKPKIDRDPITAQFKSAELDAATKAALARAKEPGTLQAENAEADRIYLIRIVGVKKIEPEAVISQLTTHVGDALDKKAVAEDIRRIFGMGLFSDVVVEEEDGPQKSIVLNYVLTEKPTIHQIRIDGNDAISEDDIKDVIDLKAYQVADIPRIRGNLDKIKNLYMEKGYFLADVSYEVVKTKAEDIEKNEEQRPKVMAPDFVDVVFHVNERAKVQIDSIAFMGNEHFSGDTLRGVMQTKEAHLLGPITNWGTFHEEAFEIDIMLLEQFYQDHGYLNVQISKPRVQLSADKTSLAVHVAIVEGDQFHLGTLDITGDLVEADEERYKEKKEENPDAALFLKKNLLSKITLAEGDVLNRSQIGKDLVGITELYKDAGYAYVNVSPVTEVHEESRQVDLRLEVEKGPLVYIERIDIKGNVQTADEVIRRELRIYEGELYSAAMWRLSELRVQQLGFFEEVKFKSSPGSAPDQMVVEVFVKERSTGTMNVSGGYGTAGEGFIFQGQVAQNNLFGRGQTLSATVQWSRYRRIFDLRFIDPYLFYIATEPMTFAFSAYNTKQFLGSFTRSSSGGDLTLGFAAGRPLGVYSKKWLRTAPPGTEFYVPDFENLFFLLTYNVERVNVDDETLNIRRYDLPTNHPFYTTSLKPVLRFDQRNNRLFPTAGYYLELRTEFASRYLGSASFAGIENSLRNTYQDRGIAGGLWYLNTGAVANDFMRFGINLRAYYNFDRWFIWKDWVLKFNLDIGFLNTLGQTIIFENYFLGGLNTLRGYAYRSIGPVVFAEQLRPKNVTVPFVIGGNKQLLFNLELEFPLVRTLKLNGVLFFDAGNVYAPDQNFFYIGSKPQPLGTTNFDPVRDLPLGLFSAAGFGLRWLSPIGLLRFEFGFPITPRPMGTPGAPAAGDDWTFEFNIGQSF